MGDVLGVCPGATMLQKSPNVALLLHLKSLIINICSTVAGGGGQNPAGPLIHSDRPLQSGPRNAHAESPHYRLNCFPSPSTLEQFNTFPQAYSWSHCSVSIQPCIFAMPDCNRKQRVVSVTHCLSSRIGNGERWHNNRYHSLRGLVAAP